MRLKNGKLGVQNFRVLLGAKLDPVWQTILGAYNFVATLAIVSYKIIKIAVM